MRRNLSLADHQPYLANIAMPDHSSSGASPVESIRLVDRLRYSKASRPFQATSLPGHLLHLVLTGEVEQICNGRRQHLTPGSVVWYHEDEWVEGHVIQSPWTYYTVNFSAPTLAPPDFDARLIPDQQHLKPTFSKLHETWQQPPSRQRDFLCQAHLLRLIAAINPDIGQQPTETPNGRLWWEVETWARQHIERAVTLHDLCQQFRRSANTLARACQEAVGMTPMKRLKQIRLSLARGLVYHAELSMSEIAIRIGYSRVHEFSRDYRKVYGLPPSHDRNSRH
jgi:AraC-like DNA-binding protein